MERHTDTETLNPVRKVGAMHFGGVTIECLLKAMIFATLPNGASREWKTSSIDTPRSKDAGILKILQS